MSRSSSGTVTGISPAPRSEAGVLLALQGDGDGDGEIDVGDQADRGPAVPGPPADHLSGVQADGLLAELVILFNPPPGHRDGDQPGQRDRPGCPHR